jgi:hypothetical protein
VWLIEIIVDIVLLKYWIVSFCSIVNNVSFMQDSVMFFIQTHKYIFEVCFSEACSYNVLWWMSLLFQRFLSLHINILSSVLVCQFLDV